MGIMYSMLSIVILAKNESQNLHELIPSLHSISDDIIVYDDHSTDDTSSIAQSAGARVITSIDTHTFSEKRNYLMQNVRHDWILHIDADERVDEHLKQWLSARSFAKNTHTAHAIRRVDRFWGRTVSHGEVASAAQDGIVRLMPKNSGAWTGTVHETFTVKDSISVALAPGTLLHTPHETVAAFVHDINVYSTLRAEELRGRAPHYVVLLQMLVYPPAKFWYTYIVKGGWRDGAAGFAYSFLMAFHSFLVRAKILA